jgi:tripartite-type tricarboxylate transporter receptor subunit TctC
MHVGQFFRRVKLPMVFSRRHAIHAIRNVTLIDAMTPWPPAAYCLTAPGQRHGQGSLMKNAMLAILAVASLAFSASVPATGQDYPNRTITILVPFAAGGLTDVPVRLLATIMQERLRIPIVVENKPGASGTLGATQVLRSEPDGYTLLATARADAQNVHYMNIPYSAINDFALIAKIVDGPPMVLVVTAALPYGTVAELVADAKVNPAKLSFGTSGYATSPVVALNQFNAAAGTHIQDVPYRGSGQATNAVVTGAIQGAFAYYSSAKPLVDSGQLRALAVAGPRRIADWPDVPTLEESGFKGFDHSGFVGLVAPGKTPPEVVAFLNKAVNAAIGTELFRSRVSALGMTAPGQADNTPADFKAFMQAVTAREGELAKLAGAGNAKAAAPRP